MIAGESARKEAESLARAEAALRAKADFLASKAAAYREGAVGEVRLVELTRPLALHGYYGLPDLGVPGKDSNIDLVVIGPAGVFVIDSKRYSGTVEIVGSKLRQGRNPRMDAVDGVVAQAARVATALSGALPTPVPVWPVLAFTGDAKIGGYQVLDRVCLIDAEHVVESVLRFPVALSNADVDHVHSIVSQAFASRTSTVEDASDDGSSLPPHEPVIFVTEWFKHGHRRLYLGDEQGNDGGYVDLVKGELVGTSTIAHHVLRQLVPHYAGGNDGLSTADGEQLVGALAAVQVSASETIPLVAGYRWTRFGRDRLYVHYLGPGPTKLDLGWIDLGSRRVHGEVSGAAPIVRYCGERFLATRKPKR